MSLLGSIWVKLGLDNSNFKKGLNESENKTSAFSTGIKKLGGMIAGAFAVSTLARFGNEISKLAAKSEGVERAFRKIADTGTLSELRDATQGMVSDLDLMRNAVKANNFKIPLEQLATYFNFATARAAETGESVDYLVDSIITGLGRQSVMILDNLGLSAAELRKEIEGGKTMAEAVGVVIEREMGDASKAVSETARQSAQLTVEWENFKVSLGDTLNELVTPILKGINGIVDATRRAREEAESGTKVTFWEKMGQMLNPFISQTKVFAAEQKKAYKDATQEVISYITSVDKAKEVLKDISSGSYSILSVNVPEIKAFADNFIKEANKTSTAATTSGQSIDSLKEQLDLLQKAFSAATDSAKRLDLKKQIIETQKLIDAKLAEGDVIVNGLIPRIEKEIEKKNELLKFAKDESSIRQLNDEIARLQKKLTLLKMTSQEAANYNAPRTPLPAAPATPSAITGARAMTQNALDKDLKNNQEYYNNLKAQRETAIEDLKEDMLSASNIAKAFEMTVANSISGGIQSLTEAIMETGKVDTSSVLAALLTPFGEMAIQLGEYAIAAGIGVEAIKTSLSTMSGAGAIAAGIALIALGSAIKYGVASLANNNRGATAPAYTYTGGSSIGTSMQSMKIEVVGKLEGSDIRIASANSQIKQNR